MEAFKTGYGTSNKREFPDRRTYPKLDSPVQRPIKVFASDTGQLSDGCANAVMQNILGSLVHLAPIDRKIDGLYPRIGGSGTLVTIRGRNAILTARHVVESLLQRDHDHFGLTGLRLSRDDICPLPREILKAALTKGENQSEQGPDLALIYLPEHRTSTLSAIGKVFYNLDRRRETFFDDAPPETGCWLVCGFQAALAREKVIGDETLVTLASHVLSSQFARYRRRDPFDYYDVEMHLPNVADALFNYQGLSGGSLWHLAFQPGTDAEPEISGRRDDLTLFGVPFHQSPIIDGTRFIRCHGHLSLYDALYRP